MAVNPDDKGAARLARPGAAFKQYWVLFIGKITAAQPFEYSVLALWLTVLRSGTRITNSGISESSALVFCSEWRANWG